MMNVKQKIDLAKRIEDSIWENIKEFADGDEPFDWSVEFSGRLGGKVVLDKEVLK